MAQSDKQPRWQSIGKYCPYERECTSAKKSNFEVLFTFRSKRVSKFEDDEKLELLWSLLGEPLTKDEITAALTVDLHCVDVEAGKRTKKLFGEMKRQLDTLLQLGVEDSTIKKL